jgi:hypothetical protein
MKNKHFEWMRKESKAYAKPWRRNHEKTALGNVLYHSYDEGPRDFGWWDDVAFKFGSQIVHVWWVHPRMVFADKTAEIAEDSIPSLDEVLDLSGGVKNYKTLGKNKKRKRHVSTTMPSLKPQWQERYEQVKAATAEVRATTDLEIKPHMKIVQLAHGRGISLCMPIEAVDADSVEQIAEITKMILRGETTLDEMFRGYVYTKQNWVHDKSVSIMPETFD